MFENKSIHCNACLTRSHLFNLLSSDELERVNLVRNEIKFKKGEVILKQGTPMPHIIFVKTGYVKIYIEGEKSNNLIVAISKSGRYINGPGLFYDNISHYTATALTDVDTCFIDADIFKEFVKTNNLFLEAYLKEFSRRAILTFHTFKAMTQKKMYGRIADGLIYLAETFESIKFEALLNKKEIGELTNMTKESVIRTLKSLEDEGIICITDKEIEIVDIEKLKKISEKG